MIVRIATEGQYELLASDAETLDALDHQAVDACRAGDEETFDQVFHEMLDFVRTNGHKVPDEELVGSQVILPPPDSTLAEAQQELTGDGWIPE